ncbi:MAG: citrate synthase, partial [Gammaproteobacteria bacterium]|nr:citrate synthase [Gammaproteobacteria bacterium]
MSDKNYKLANPDASKVSELPLVEGTMGPPAVDVRRLYKDHGIFTYDPGFGSTVSCSSEITFINGEEGVLLFRGYPIEQLAGKSSYMEVCYLMLHGELPSKSELDEFVTTITQHTMINESLLRFFNGFHHNAHPMAMLSGVVGCLSAFYPGVDMNDPHDQMVFAHRIIAKVPTMAAASYKHSLGQPFVYPKNDLDYTSNLLHMYFSVPPEEYEIDPIAAEALDLLFILHADHEQNCSTSTVRLAGSSGTNPYAAIAAGISALWGPSHGGANEAVLAMLNEIGSTANFDKYIAKAKDKEDPFRLMGFGHRVYKSFDPRATIIRKMCHKVLENLGQVDTPLFDLALKLEEVALKDEYFIKRGLYPNVDFYSGIIYKALGIPTNMYTVMFAIARTVGWVSQ